MPERVLGFVSLKEKYKRTPEMVADYIQGLGMKRAEKPFLNFVRIDKATPSGRPTLFSRVTKEQAVFRARAFSHMNGWMVPGFIALMLSVDTFMCCLIDFLKIICKKFGGL